MFDIFLFSLRKWTFSASDKQPQRVFRGKNKNHNYQRSPYIWNYEFYVCKRILFTNSDYMNHTFADTYERVSELVGPTLPVKYPRTPGYRPSPEENVYNAW